MINKKGSMALSGTLLAIAALALVIYALFSFQGIGNISTQTLGVSFNIESLYGRELQLNFILEGIVKAVASEAGNREEFLAGLKSELGKYKDASGGQFKIIPELAQVESQISAENIIKENGKFALKLNLVVNYQVRNDYYVSFDSSYAYKKVFLSKVDYEQTLKTPSS